MTDELKAYLFSLLPDEYPIKDVPLSLSMDDAHKKELVFQQSRFLDEVEESCPDCPELQLLASLKHEHTLRVLRISSASFKEIQDKEYLKEVSLKADSIASDARKNLDPRLVEAVEKLALLQALYSSLVKVRDICENAISRGFERFEPPVQSPGDDPTTELGCGCLLIIVGVGLSALLLGPFLAVILAGIGLVILITIFLVNKGKMDDYEKRKRKYDKFCELRNKFYQESEKIWGSFGFIKATSPLNLHDLINDIDSLTNQREELELLVLNSL